MKTILNAVAFLAVAVMSTTACAQTWDETADGCDDAGNILTGVTQGAESGTSFDTITGSLDGTDQDTYLIRIDDANWSAIIEDQVITQNSPFEDDTRLWVFDRNRNLLQYNDDGGPGAYSEVGDAATHSVGAVDAPVDPAVGDFVYLVVNGFGDTAQGDDGNGGFVDLVDASVFEELTGPQDVNITEITNWNGSNDRDSGDYQINLTGATLLATVRLGDINCDGTVDFLDISPFIQILSSGGFLKRADIDGSGDVDFLDISPFIGILSGA